MRKWTLFLLAFLLLGCNTDHAGFLSSTPLPAQSQAVQATAQSAQATASALAAAGQQLAASETRAAVQATHEAVEATAVANRATAEAAAANAATATAVYVATADYLSFRATAVAVDATATAVDRLALLEEQALVDQATFLANERARQAEAVRRARFWNDALPYLVALLAAVLVGSLVALARVLDNRSRPVVAPDGRVLALPANAYQWAPGMRQPEPEEVVAGEFVSQPVNLPPAPEGHVLVVGPTRSGKSTAFRALIKGRSNVTVIDPHYAHGDWRGARVIGAGGDIEAIETQLRHMEQVLERRMAQLAQDHTWKRRFEPMTVVTDELPLLAKKMGGSAMGVWQRWLREGWKFKLYFVVGTQSTRVKTLGIEGEGDVLDNVHGTLYLGGAALAEFPEVAESMARPAVWQESGRPSAQPVVIPYDPTEDPDSPQFRPAGVGAPTLSHVPPPQLGSGRHSTEPTGMGTPGGFVTEDEARQMVSLHGRGWTRSDICRHLYNGNDGGAPYLRVKHVLDTLVGEVEAPSPPSGG